MKNTSMLALCSDLAAPVIPTDKEKHSSTVYSIHSSGESCTQPL